jgi:hypothetical protein
MAVFVHPAPLGRPFRGRPIRSGAGLLAATGDRSEQHTTYAKTGHTVPEKPWPNLPLNRIEVNPGRYGKDSQQTFLA